MNRLGLRQGRPSMPTEPWRAILGTTQHSNKKVGGVYAHLNKKVGGMYAHPPPLNSLLQISISVQAGAVV